MKRRLLENSPPQTLLFATLFLLVGCGLGQPDVTRIVSESCDNERPNQNFDPEDFPRTNGSQGCDDDNECTEGQNGRCVAQYGFGSPKRYCNYDECFDDGDCKTKEACSCGKNRHTFYSKGRADENVCVPSNCRTDDDCGDQFCKPDHGYSGADDRVFGYYCTTRSDECRNDLDCQIAGGRSRCTVSGGSHWSCMGGDG